MKIAPLLAVLLLCGGAVALADGMVTVHAVDARTHKPLVGRKVRLTNAFTDLVSVTNRAGDALFLTVPDGRTTIDIDDARYRSRCTPYFTVSFNQHSIVTVHLIAASVRESTPAPLCPLSRLVNPGEGADVYDVF